MSRIPRAYKDPGDVLDYSRDWTDFLDTDTITASTWSVPDGITMDSESNTSTVATVWLSGGTLGERYTVTNTIETEDGRTVEGSITIIMQNR